MRPSFGHSSNQSIVVQFTKLGKSLSLVLNASPIGLKQIINFSWSFTLWRKKLKSIGMVASPPSASTASFRTASHIYILYYEVNKFGTVPTLRMLLMSSKNCSSFIWVSANINETNLFLTPISLNIFFKSSLKRL